MKMYALGQTSHLKGIIHPESRGYSVYYYQPNTSSKYCVIHKEERYDQQRFFLNFGSVLIFICTVFSFPILFIEFYKLLWNKLNHQSGSEYWRFITWSVVIVSLIANILILVNNTFVLKLLYNEYSSSFMDIFAFLTVFIIFCFGGWIINYISCIGIIAYMNSKKDFSKRFPLPALIRETIKGFNVDLSTSGTYRSDVVGSENDRKCCPQCTALALGYAIFVHFLQLVSFHIVYIILGAVACPAETLSVFFDYVTAYLFSVMSMAIILKYMNKLYFDRVPLNCLACILPLSIAGLALIGAVACFTVYFYRYTEMMESNSQNEGLWGVVKTILPSSIVLFLGYCGHKLLRYIKKRNKHDVHLGNNARSSSEFSSSVSSNERENTVASSFSVLNNLELPSNSGHVPLETPGSNGISVGDNHHSSRNSRNFSFSSLQNNGDLNRVPASNSMSVAQVPETSHSDFRACRGQGPGETEPLLKTI